MAGTRNIDLTFKQINIKITGNRVFKKTRLHVLLKGVEIIVNIRPGVFNEISHVLNLLGTKSEALWMFKLIFLGIVFFITFFNFTLCIRYYNHVGFMINTFQQTDSSVSVEAVTRILNHGALHYTIGMRGFYLSVPLALWLFGPSWMLAGSLVVVSVLYHLDREA